MFRYRIALSGLLMGLMSQFAMADAPVVYKSPTCQCCSRWMEHMKAGGIELSAENVSPGELNRIKSGHGLKREQASCHTAIIQGYVIEGHVPAADVKRLLEEKPDAIGLAVPGMPVGSPGMEMGDEKDSFQVLLIRKDGSTEVWASY